MTFPHTEGVTSQRLNNISSAWTDCIGNQSVRTATAPAFFALALLLYMLANAAATTILACALHPSMLENEGKALSTMTQREDHTHHDGASAEYFALSLSPLMRRRFTSMVAAASQQPSFTKFLVAR